MELEIGGWRIDIDPKRTADYYARSRHGCTCADCRNFRAAVRTLPPSSGIALESLGVDPQKEPGEIMHFVGSRENWHQYMAIFPLVGTVVGEPGQGQKSEGGLAVWFEPASGFAPTPKGFPQPAIQAVLQGWLPWVIDDAPDPLEPLTAAGIDRLSPLRPNPSPWWKRLFARPPRR